MLVRAPPVVEQRAPDRWSSSERQRASVETTTFAVWPRYSANQRRTPVAALVTRVHADLDDREKPRLWSISDTETHMICLARQLDPQSVHATA